MRKLIGLIVVVVMLSVAQVASAGSYEDGLAAYDRGDYATALKLFQPLADQGDVQAKNNLGVMYQYGQGVAQDYKEAVRLYRLAADQGYELAQYNLGVMYAHGQGVAQDYKEAVKWHRLAAAQGVAEAQYNLGVMYDNGQGVPRDNKEAVKWYRLAADHGVAQAQFNLGLMYANKQGVAQDYEEAAKWYRLAADQGDARAQYNLGVIYFNGQGVAQDYKEAVKWFRLAAVQGDAQAQGNLGVMYGNGQGVAQDYVRAYMWSNLAASLFSGEDRKLATKNRDSIAAKMTPAQIAQAREVTQKCQQSNYQKCDNPESIQTTTATLPASNIAAVNKLTPTPSSSRSVQMRKQGGIYVVPVIINNAIALDFVVDSGAADVSIPTDVFLTLMRTGTIKDTDFLGTQTYVLADGSKVPSQIFRIRSLKVGDVVLENVTGSVSDVRGFLLLGQSFLGQFKSWSIDNTAHALVLQ